MCLFTNPSELCNHPECQRFIYSSATLPINNTNLIGNLNLLIQQQSLALSELISQNALLNNKLDCLQNSMKGSQKVTQQDSTLNNDDIFRIISSDRVFHFFIHLVSEFPSVIFKERGFPLHINIVDTSGCKVEILANLSLSVSLFTMENPPKALKNNISGKKIIRGTIEAVVENGEALFTNVVINEVTSHYPNNKFCFVVMCNNSQEVKPLVISGITVRARKHKQ